MKQPIKGKGKIKRKKPKVSKRYTPFKLKHKSDKQYGTSKLERDFARDFLDANNIIYIYQYELKEIGRWIDFAVTSYTNKQYIMEEKDGINCVKQEGQYFDVSFFIEIDGSYYHSDPRVVDTDKLNPMQKHNKFVDKLKDHYAGMHCIPLVRIWEYDIRNNPQKVLEELKKYIAIGDKKKIITENKKRPH